MARELKGLGAGLIAGLGVVGAAFGVSAIATHGQPSSATPEKPHAAAGVPVTVVSQIVTTGHGYYLTSCAGCHGKDGRGVVGPNLHNLGDPDAKIALNIKNGFKGQMPAYKDSYNDTQIAALVAYIQSLT